MWVIYGVVFLRIRRIPLLRRIHVWQVVFLTNKPACSFPSIETKLRWTL